MGKIRSHEDLEVFQLAFKTSMEIFDLSKTFPADEKFSLTDQIRRSSRSVSGNIAEGFRKRRYPKSFVAKLIDAEGEAAETQVWLLYAVSCKYIDSETRLRLNSIYDMILEKLVNMGMNPEKWTY
ncbi:four helix bundle protein [Shivajiella indica]|uniref:Four helix bundle protein n=1 Tax=Shivajiella indica TaxID=872115 RepID=A0ABW5BA82_9BACT